MDSKDKVIALYRYIRELSALKYSIITNIENQVWTCFLKDIPNDSDNITVYYRDRIEEESSGNDYLLEVHKPEFQQCPPPPEIIAEWLADGWERFTSEVELIELKKSGTAEYQTEKLDALPERLHAFKEWNAARKAWAEQQHRISKTRKFFTRLYHIYTDLERDSEQLELMVGEGLITDIKNTAISHPVVLKRVKITFDAKANIIRIHDADTEPELYTLLLQEMCNINHGVVKQLIEELNENFYHPLDRHDTPDFLKALIHHLCANSKFIGSEDKVDIKSDDQLLMMLNPVFFVRKRIDGSLKAIDEIIRTIEQTGNVPGHLYDITCAGKVDILFNERELTIEEQLAAASGESTNILLAKEANREQLEIAQQIERYNAVVVQGPPGTGKTHTIANLLGHFLAQGKSVLVTSHTKKALAVLKDKVPAGIQNLCVSILDDTNLDMERSVDGISDYLSKRNSYDLKNKMEAARCARLEIIGRLAELRKKLFTIKYQEFQPIVYNGDGYSPTQAADFVNKNAECLSYIPGPVSLYHPMPLTFDELTKLYRSNTEVTASEEDELDIGLPNPDYLLNPSDLETICFNRDECQKKLRDIEDQMKVAISFDYANECVIAQNSPVGTNLATQPSLTNLQKLAQYIEGFKAIDEWMIFAAVDGNKGGGYKKRWEMLINAIEESVCCADELVADMLGRDVTIDSSADITQLKSSLAELNTLLNKKQKWTKLDLLFHRKIKLALDFIKVDGSSIANMADCIMVQKYLTLLEKRSTVESYWDELMSCHNVPRFASLGDEPEIICRQQTAQIKRCLNWYQTDYGQLLQLIRTSGLNAELIFAASDFDSEITKTQKAMSAVTDVIPLYIELVKVFIELKADDAKITQCLKQLEQSGGPQSAVCKALKNALRNRDLDLYKKGLAELINLYKKYGIRKERREILARLEPIAPEWADQIRNRVGIHGETTPPSTIQEAWKWKQFVGIIDELTAEPYQELQYKTAALSKELRRQTAQLAEYAAWYHLLLRTETDLDMRQALQGWKKTVKKIGKGTGKNAPALKSAARKLMAKCQAAVPAWIMPVNKALESLNPAQNKFDIVVIDEASQSDITALAIVYMAKKIIVVGDDKQVSPMAVGANLDKMNALIEMYIKDIIPNWHLYDTKSSLYDIAGTTFQPLMLCEHFRCVPEIIGYSNKLSYDYKIKPLRDVSKCIITPPVINYRVTDGKRDSQKKINQKEAETIAALIQSCIEQKEYDGASFGVISLLGDEQAAKIQQMILEKLPAAVVQDRRILCGNASHFQGDERTVVFLSMVDNNEKDGPLTLAGEGADQSRKQRYNVAASRAKDQMWIIHSLDIAKDLKPGDMRRELLEYAENPKAYLNLVAAIENKAESPFEAAVAKTLTAAGYHLVQQWEVGAYRIDMVAVYNGDRVAIECDGEMYHSGQEKVREDMERQTILERLGWRFIRIRGSEYYRNPEATIQRVINELNEYEVYPETAIDIITDGQTSSELLERVKIRAHQILKDWHAGHGAIDIDLIEDYEQLTELPSVIQTTGRTLVFKEDDASYIVHERENQAAEAEPITDKRNELKKKILNNSQVSSVPSFGTFAKNPPEKRPNGDKISENLIKMLQADQIKFIDRREKSGIIWVYYSEQLKDKLEAICRQYGITLALEKRGSASTQNKPAWRVMVK